MAAPTSTPVNRFVRSDQPTTSMLAISGVQINLGDLLWASGGQAAKFCQPANQYPWTSGNEIQNWSGFRSQFVGVALGNNNAQDPRSGFVTVGLGGFYSFPVVVTSGTTYGMGTFVGPTIGATTGNISNSGYFNNQALMQCSGASTAIGTVVDPTVAGVSGQGQLTCYIQSYLAFGGFAT